MRPTLGQTAPFSMKRMISVTFWRWLSGFFRRPTTPQTANHCSLLDQNHSRANRVLPGGKSYQANFSKGSDAGHEGSFKKRSLYHVYDQVDSCRVAQFLGCLVNIGFELLVAFTIVSVAENPVGSGRFGEFHLLWNADSSNDLRAHGFG